MPACLVNNSMSDCFFDQVVSSMRANHLSPTGEGTNRDIEAAALLGTT